MMLQTYANANNDLWQQQMYCQPGGNYIFCCVGLLYTRYFLSTRFTLIYLLDRLLLYWIDIYTSNLVYVGGGSTSSSPFYFVPLRILRRAIYNNKKGPELATELPRSVDRPCTDIYSYRVYTWVKQRVKLISQNNPLELLLFIFFPLVTRINRPRASIHPAVDLTYVYIQL